MTSLDVEYVRSLFPAFADPDTGRWAHLENAGGSYAAGPVIDILHRFFVSTKVQPYWAFGPSHRAGEAMDLAKARLPATFGRVPADSVSFGPSTTQNTYVLAHALRATLRTGDEVIVTNQDHEANIGAWRRMADTGLVVREWPVDPHTGLLSTDDLDHLVTDRTRVLAVTHASNLTATINPIAPIAAAVHAAGGIVVVDGVSHAPHHHIDVAALDCDIYLYSTYKTFGPHLGLMWVRPEVAAALPNQGHWFNEAIAGARLTPAGPDHAEIAAAAGIMAYFDAVHAHHHDTAPTDDVSLVADVYDLFGDHEATLMAPMIDFLTTRDGVRLLGSPSADPAVRHPTFAFTSERRSSAEIAATLVGAGVACGSGHFYSRRLVEAVGIDPGDGVVRLSAAHYTTGEDIDRALTVLDEIC